MIYDFTTTVSLTGSQLFVDDPDFVKIWLRCFTVTVKTKKSKNNNEVGGCNVIIVLVLATSGCEVVIPFSLMTYPSKLEDMLFE